VRPALSLGRIVEVLRARGLLEEVRGTEDVAVLGVTQDSRSVRPGDLFLAWRGATVDAHDFVAHAAGRGASAAVVERPLDLDLPQVIVVDGRLAGALAADVVLGSPGRSLVLVGVTGTNGKTTTALLLRSLLQARWPAAALGTLGVVGPDGRVRPGTEGLTTPGPVQLVRWLRDLADEGVEAVTLEASSHALEQRRMDALSFRAGVFTNLGSDHLDYHADAGTYRSAKLRLLDLLGDGGFAVVNADDPAWADLPAGTRTLTYGIDAAEVDLRAENVTLTAEGATFDLAVGGTGAMGGTGARRAPVALPLLGRFNVENALAAAGAAIALGLDLDDVARNLARAPAVPGRLEVVTRDPVTVVIDFAHTPDALERVLSTLRPLVAGRLVVVFGAGGDRDRTKRRPMAEAVARHADVILLTSDNPRTEDPEAILDDLEEGLRGRVHERVADRRRAIGRALELAGEGDLVLLAGKGHETYQLVGGERRPFDERVVVAELLAGRGAA